MADISSLGTLAPSEPLDLDTYPDRQAGAGFPRKGTYTLRAPEAFPVGKTKAGNLSVTVDSTIVGPTNEGVGIRFQRVSNTTFQRGGRTASQLGDYLRACGLRGSVPADPQTQANMVEGTANRTYQAKLDWRLFAKGHGEGGTDLVIKGMENFPSDGKGGFLPYTQSLTQKGDDGQPQMLRANLEVTDYIPAG